jgi:hypothetical protein
MNALMVSIIASGEKLIDNVNRMNIANNSSFLMCSRIGEICLSSSGALIEAKNAGMLAAYVVMSKSKY